MLYWEDFAQPQIYERESACIPALQVVNFRAHMSINNFKNILSMDIHV